MHCLINNIIHRKNKDDSGFMGYTHALSAIAVSLVFIAFAPDLLSKILLTSGAMSVWVLMQFAITMTGAAMIPDLDNSTSRAKNDLGIFGVILSSIFRATSVIVQTTVRTKRDDAEPNPHRGFWHTIPAALILGFGAYLLTRIHSGNISVPFYGEANWGTLSALIITFLLTHLTLSTLAKEFMDKIKKSAVVGEIVAFVITLSLTLLLFVNLPKDVDFWWLGVSIALGMFVHILGDCFTTAGCPIFFPLTGFIKGKFWWTTRFTHMKAGGAAEKMLVIPLCVIAIVVALGKIVLGLF